MSFFTQGYSLPPAKRTTKYRFYTVAMLVVANIILFVTYDFFDNIGFRSDVLFYSLGIARYVSPAIVVLYLMYWFMMTGYGDIFSARNTPQHLDDLNSNWQVLLSEIQSIKYSTDARYKELSNAVSTIQSKISNTKNTESTILSEKEKQRIIQQIATDIKDNAQNCFINEIRDKLTSTEQCKAYHACLDQHRQNAEEHLVRQIEALKRTGIINLLIGILFTAGGLAVLGYVVFNAQSSTTDSPTMYIYYATRLSLVIFVEIFAYFFLRLYKYSLTEIRYFQNEMTSVQLKLTALYATMTNPTELNSTPSIQALSNTERNCILKKNETTQEIERAKAESSENSRTIDIIARIFSLNRRNIFKK